MWLLLFAAAMLSLGILFGPPGYVVGLILFVAALVAAGILVVGI